MPNVNRRQVVVGLMGLPVALLTYPVGLQAAGQSYFIHGVASGDPTHDSVVLWTRIEADQPVDVAWELAQDVGFRKVVRQGVFSTNVHRDYTVKVVADQLKQGAAYFYRFTHNGVTSVTGRTRTMPTGSLNRLCIALVSCSNYPFGYFNGYDAIARDEAVEYVLHTGDYIYEYAADGWGGTTGRQIGREHKPANEIVSLSDYRQRHAQYKRDAGSLAMHAAKPLLALWDDHESANNPWSSGAQNHQANEGTWAHRRSASLRAYYEWMPIRDPAPGQDPASLWRNYVFGDLASLITMETRHTARAKQINYSDHMASIKTQEDARRFEREVLGAPDRPMISAQMAEFVTGALQSSLQSQQPWRLIGNAIPMAKIRVPDVSAQGISMPLSESVVPGAQADLVWKGKYNLPFYLDTWDGYPWAREAFFDLCRNAGAADLFVLTGDSHSFWANELQDDNNRKMGIEIGTAGISSPGDFLESGFDKDTALQLDQLFAQQIKEVRWTDNFHQGYVRIEFNRESAQATYLAVSTVLKPEYTVSTVRTEIIRHQDGSLVYEE
jgi:alkaline phosphatase D